MPLYLDTAYYSARGARHDEQSCLIVVPPPEHDPAHGALLAIADGIADRPTPQAAARDALKALGEHYYAAPENWGLKHAMQESFAVANHSLLTTGERGRAAALSALVLRRRRWAIAHAGHTRVWLMRDREIKLLTRDRVAPRVAQAATIERACGLGPQVEADFFSGEIAEGDVFVLTNPSTHRVLTGAEILACVVADVAVPQMAGMIVEKAGRAGGTDAGACVVRVEQVPPESEVDIEEDVAALPIIPAPEVGETVDDFRIERLVHKSSRYRLYKALDTQSGQMVALKFPNPKDAADDVGFAERFLREEWIGRRVSSAHLVRTLSLRKGRRTALYSVMAYPSGESLAKRLARKGNLPLREVVYTGGQLLEALGQLHDQGVIHNDIRPQNIVKDSKTGNLMLLGLGASHVTHTSTAEETTTTVTRRGSFLAPELFDPEVDPNVRTDVFAAGVTLYRMLTGAYPFGKLTGDDAAPRGPYVSARRHRVDLPVPLDAVLERACALDPSERFDSALEFADALQASLTEPAAPAPAKVSLPIARKWNWEIAAVATLVVILIVYLMFALRR